jgi:hypothetical protein
MSSGSIPLLSREKDYEFLPVSSPRPTCCHSCCSRSSPSLVFRLHGLVQKCCDIDDAKDYAAARRRKRCVAGGEFAAAAAACLAFERIIHNPFCNWLFKCGCTWTWEGGWKDCNVHNETGPKCPWCMARASVEWLTNWFLFALMILSFIFVLYHRRRFSSPLLAALARWTAPFIMYFVAGIIVGAAFKSDYPYFIAK